MNRFGYTRAGDVAATVAACTRPNMRFLAGGTNLVD
jgi:CO/xanthine dehydrogenase FAD-binding subunit